MRTWWTHGQIRKNEELSCLEDIKNERENVWIRMYEWECMNEKHCIVCTGMSELVKIMNGMIVCGDI